uniref:G_PROTEIN_RECEP_F1_2 domain-containing protein n=1 Tax=Meloidogyne hapla TaxID=6305 RepID=A0A1I8BBF7_MELHA
MLDCNLILIFSYNNLKLKYYLFVQLSILLIFNTIIFCTFTLPALQYINPQLTGHPLDIILFASTINTALIFIPLTLFVISGLIYTILLILAKFSTALNDETLKKLFRSLFLIVFFNIGSFFIYFVEIAVIKFSFEIISVKLWFLLTYSGIVYIIGSAANAPILFINSSDYKEAYLKEFNLIKTFFKKIFNNSVVPVNDVVPRVNIQQEIQIVPSTL